MKNLRRYSQRASLPAGSRVMRRWFLSFLPIWEHLSRLFGSLLSSLRLLKSLRLVFILRHIPTRRTLTLLSPVGTCAASCSSPKQERRRESKAKKMTKTKSPLSGRRQPCRQVCYGPLNCAASEQLCCVRCSELGTRRSFAASTRRTTWRLHMQKLNLHYRKSKMGSFLRILMKLPLPRAVGDLATDSPEGIAEQLRFRIVYPCLQIDSQNRILH